MNNLNKYCQYHFLGILFFFVHLTIGILHQKEYDDLKEKEGGNFIHLRSTDGSLEVLEIVLDVELIAGCKPNDPTGTLKGLRNFSSWMKFNSPLQLKKCGEGILQCLLRTFGQKGNTLK